MEIEDPLEQKRYLPYIDEVIDLLRAGLNYEAILVKHPDLSIEDIKACHQIGMQRLNREAASQPVYCRLDTRKK